MTMDERIDELAQEIIEAQQNANETEHDLTDWNRDTWETEGRHVRNKVRNYFDWLSIEFDYDESLGRVTVIANHEDDDEDDEDDEDED